MKKNGEKVCEFKKSITFAPHLEKCTYKKGYNAEIAQLVEHNLAKVGVAGPSPVFRSTF